MTTTKTEIQSLLERVRSATGPDRELDLLIHAKVAQRGQWSAGDVAYALTDIEGTTCPPNYTASIDAAVALVEHVLPGWICAVSQPGTAWLTMVDMPPPPIHLTAEAATPPLAILTATLTALLHTSAGDE